jgi:hypothetical protein
MPTYGLQAKQRSMGREWEMLGKLAGKQRKEIARKAANKARRDEKRREEP